MEAPKACGLVQSPGALCALDAGCVLLSCNVLRWTLGALSGARMRDEAFGGDGGPGSHTAAALVSTWAHVFGHTCVSVNRNQLATCGVSLGPPLKCSKGHIDWMTPDNLTSCEQAL